VVVVVQDAIGVGEEELDEPRSARAHDIVDPLPSIGADVDLAPSLEDLFVVIAVGVVERHEAPFGHRRPGGRVQAASRLKSVADSTELPVVHLYECLQRMGQREAPALAIVLLLVVEERLRGEHVVDLRAG
jgi:hypothetical protein